jgi:hypothetical protein
MLAASISVLNARRPGAGAWTVLMNLLVLVMLIPWLEAYGLAGNANPLRRLRLSAPWNWFFVVLVITGITNYVPTRYGPAAVVLAAAFGAEYLGLVGSGWSRATQARLWSTASWFFAVGICAAEVRGSRKSVGESASSRVWFWFRDHWGVVWALRVQERFNESARAQSWPVRLSWHGIVPVEGREDEALPELTEATLFSLLRRFASPERIAAEAGAACEYDEARGS